MLKNIKQIVIASSLILSTTLPLYAQPTIHKIDLPPNRIYLPISFPNIGSKVENSSNTANCYRLDALNDVPSGCVFLQNYLGDNGIGDYISIVNNGVEDSYIHNMPSIDKVLTNSELNLSAIDKTPITSNRITITGSTFITATEMIGPLSRAKQQAPIFSARLAWFVWNALQDKNTPTPALFPVTIGTIHYASPTFSSPVATIFQECGEQIAPGQLLYYGLPYDLIADDHTATGGNVWIAMHYAKCSAMYPYPYVPFQQFWKSLVLDPKYANAESEGQALVDEHLYTYENVTVKSPGGLTAMGKATVVVIVVGTTIIWTLFPEIPLLEGGFYVLIGVVH